MNNLAPVKNFPGVQGNLNRMPGYMEWSKMDEIKMLFTYQKLFFINKLFHAHFQYICNIPANDLILYNMRR